MFELGTCSALYTAMFGCTGIRMINHELKPIPVAARSKAWVCGRSLAGVAGANPASGMDVSCERCVLSGRGLCDGLKTRQ